MPGAAPSEWDDEDEKTTVFDKSSEESARALLSRSPGPPGGTPAAPSPAGAPVPVVMAAPAGGLRSLPPGLPPSPSAPNLARPSVPPTPAAFKPPPAASMSTAPVPPRPASSQPPPPPRPSGAPPAFSSPIGSMQAPLSNPTLPGVPRPAGAPPGMFPSAPAALPPSMPSVSRPASVQVPSGAQHGSFPPPSLGPQSSPMGSMPHQSMPMASSMPMEAPASGRRGMLVGGLGVAAIAAIAYFFMQGPDTGDLAISVSGPGGKPVTGVVVLVDGAEACQDSVCKVTELEKGSHKVSARAAGYDETAPKLVSIKAGEEEVLNLELVSSTAGTGLDVDLKAPGMVLTLDGKEIGSLPQKVMDLSPGQHQIELSGNKLFKPFKDSVTLEAGKVLDFEPKLELEQGQLTITLGDNANGAKILLEGGGKTFALHKKKLPLTINIPADQTFTLTATRDGYEDFDREIRFSVEEPQKSIEISLSEEDGDSSSSQATSSSSSTRSSSSSQGSSSRGSAGQGMLNINSIPVSNIILDGKPIGSTPKLGVKVSPGRHTVVFVHPQHGRKTSSVNVAAGGTATAAVRFP